MSELREPQAELRQQVHEYIESLKPDWHQALASLREEQQVGPEPREHRPTER